MDPPHRPQRCLPSMSIFAMPENRVHSPATAKWHFEARQALSEGLEELRKDHTSGANVLATKAVEWLVQIAGIIHRGLAQESQSAAERHKENSQVWWDAVRTAGWALSTQGRPSMGAAITVAVLKALEQAKSFNQDAGVGSVSSADTGIRPNGEGTWLTSQMVQKMEEYLLQRADSVQAQIGLNLRGFLRERFLSSSKIPRDEVKILTLSMSSTITKALDSVLKSEKDADISLGRLNICLRVMESRPMCEGAEFARALATLAARNGYDHLLRIELAADSSVAILARDLDMVLIGADRISETGDVSNKTGSFPAVLCAKKLSDRVIVTALSDVEKVAKPGSITQHKEEDNDSTELSRVWSPQVQESAKFMPWRQIVTIKNVYFEWVPANYIDHYICESGILSVADIKRQSEWVMRTEQRIFGDLEGLTMDESIP